LETPRNPIKIQKVPAASLERIGSAYPKTGSLGTIGAARKDLLIQAAVAKSREKPLGRSASVITGIKGPELENFSQRAGANSGSDIHSILKASTPMLAGAVSLVTGLPFAPAVSAITVAGMLKRPEKQVGAKAPLMRVSQFNPGARNYASMIAASKIGVPLSPSTEKLRTEAMKRVAMRPYRR